MPRSARVKSPSSVYHIMVRSISEVLLFADDDDKNMYLGLIKKYQRTYSFKVYGYCLMDTHGHLIIDPCGADISKIMHCINQCYAQYYNRVHKRHGHLFQDRFKSKIVSDDRNLVSLSAYISRNPKDIEGYRGREEHYPYSSYGIYVGIAEDDFQILNPYFILSLFSDNIARARRLYREFVSMYDKNGSGEDDPEFARERADYRSERHIILRRAQPSNVIDFVSRYTKTDRSYINVKYIKDASDFKSLSALIMRCMCDMSERAICGEMGNITQSHVARLYHRGADLIERRDEYKNMLKDFVEQMEKAS